jgi:hypothetical protein
MDEREPYKGRTDWGFTAPCAKHYPMDVDNPCLNMTETEFLAYIRMRRREFEIRHKLPLSDPEPKP